MGEGEVDLGLDRELDVIRVDNSLGGVLRVDLCVADDVSDVTVPEFEKLVHNPWFILCHAHRSEKRSHDSGVARAIGFQVFGDSVFPSNGAAGGDLRGSFFGRVSLHGGHGGSMGLMGD